MRAHFAGREEAIRLTEFFKEKLGVEITLKGLTWDHPRGYAPLVGGVSVYQQWNPNVNIHWDRRTLREFGEAPIEQYLDRYDLLIVDHPFVGFAAAHNVLVDLAPSLSERKSNFSRRIR